MYITKRSDAHKLSVNKRLAEDAAPIDINGALTLLELSDLACLVEDMLYTRADDGSRHERPTAANPETEFDEACDAYVLRQQLKSPRDHVCALHRRLKRALAGRIGWVSLSQQRLVLASSRWWPGALEVSRQGARDFTERFWAGEVSLAETRRVTGIAFGVVRIAQHFVRRTEAALLFIANGEPFAGPVRPGGRNWNGTWSLVEMPSGSNSRWDDDTPMRNRQVGAN